MDIRLDGKVLHITGSSQGVGRAIALEAARSGAAGILVTGRGGARFNSLKARSTSSIRTTFAFMSNDPQP